MFSIYQRPTVLSGLLYLIVFNAHADPVTDVSDFFHPKGVLLRKPAIQLTKLRDRFCLRSLL